MRSLMKKVDMFCYKHPRFGIPNLMLYVVIGNAIVWLFMLSICLAVVAFILLTVLSLAVGGFPFVVSINHSKRHI